MQLSFVIWPLVNGSDPANWKPEDTRRFNEALKEELSKERATSTNIELIINDIAKLHTWTERKEVPQKERLSNKGVSKGRTRKWTW